MPTPAPTTPITAPAALDGQLVALVGGGGFVGRAAAQAILQAGARVRIVQRNPRSAVAVKALGNLGQVQFAAADVTRPASLARALAGVDHVVNLAGSFARMQAVQADGARHVAEAARSAGVVSLVHVSAIGADPASPALYGRSKAAGEAAVRAQFPDAVILRPSIIFGRDDAFINRFAGILSRAPVMPVFAPNTLFQPVFVGNVADAVAAALVQPGARGQIFELGGPRQISMRDLLRWIATQIHRAPLLIDMPDALAGAIARGTGWLPGAPITADQWLMLGSDNIISGDHGGLAELWIMPTALEAVAPGWLDRYRRHGRFAGKAAA